MSKDLVKSSKKKQRLYEKNLKDRNPEKELNYEQYKTLFESLKKKSKKNYKHDIKKRGMLLKKFLETKESPNALLPNFSPVKIREIFDKKEI